MALKRDCRVFSDMVKMTRGERNGMPSSPYPHTASKAQEKERLTLKKGRLLKLYRDGYLEASEFDRAFMILAPRSSQRSEDFHHR